jgi:hypothetical protein
MSNSINSSVGFAKISVGSAAGITVSCHLIDQLATVMLSTKHE